MRILESELKRRETLEATLCSRVGIANLQKAQAELLLEAKVHELARVYERIPSLEAAVIQRESQILTLRAKAHAYLLRLRRQLVW